MLCLAICISLLATSLAKGLNISDELVGIVGGNTATFGKFPFIVLIDIFTKDKNYICAGSLIGHEWILTAAHCTYPDPLPVTGVTAYVGGVRLREGTSYDIAIGDIIRHEHFHPPATAYDISLMRIRYPKRHSSIKTLKLPFGDEDRTFAYMRGYALGWGYMSDHGPESDVLKYKDFIVMKNEDCEKDYKSLRESQLCIAAVKGKSPCVGDSGGPFVYQSRYGPMVIGVNSFIVKGTSCELGFPVAYTRVTSYLSWISAKTRLFGMTKKRKTEKSSTNRYEIFLSVIQDILKFNFK